MLVDQVVHFEVLGPLGARRHDDPVDLGPARQRAVLSALLLTPGHPVPPEQLTEAVWPRKAPAEPAANLYSYVSHLRRILEPRRPPRERDTLLRRVPSGYVLATPPESVDAVRFERLLREGRAQLAAGHPTAAADTLRQALSLWRGRPHPEVSDYAPGFQIAARYEELRLVALESLWEAELSAGRDVSVLAVELTALTMRFPTRERFSRLLMLALYRAGRRAEAVEAYHRARRSLAEEYGIDPGSELQDLFGRILCGETVSG